MTPGICFKIIPKGIGVGVGGLAGERGNKIVCLSTMFKLDDKHKAIHPLLVLYTFESFHKKKFKNKPMWLLPFNFEISSWPHSTVLTLTSERSRRALWRGPYRSTRPWTEPGAWGTGSQWERSSGRKGMQAAVGGGGVHSPTADSATVGFRVSLKHKSQKSKARSPAPIHLVPFSRCSHFFTFLPVGS